LRLDRTAGVEPRGPWSFRLKRYVRLRTGGAVDAPSATIVLGPFGDVVRYAGGDLVLSWYPAGCTGLSLAIRHPDADTRPTPDDEARIRMATRRALCSLVPALRDVPRAAFARAEVEGGIILAHGTTDVSDPASGLHARNRVGPRSHGRYHSVNPGKWTTAPFFALELARRIAEGA
jgi:hypothetical protein